MDDPRNDAQTQATTDTACEMTLDQHIEMAMGALTLFGLGLGCETEYRALLVIAEVAKQMHGHAAFDPLPRATELVTMAKAEIARRKAAAENPPHYVPDNGQVH